MNRRLVALLALCVLASCAAVTPTPSLDPTAAPDPKLGYVAGSFSVLGQESRFAFRLAGQEGSGYHLGFGEPTQVGYETRLIPLPPGVYRVDTWVAYSSMGGEQKREEVYGTLGTSFVVRPGHVVYLGRFAAKTEVNTTWLNSRSRRIRTTWTIQPEKVRADEVAGTIRSGFPRFEAAPLECLLCAAPQADADAFAQPALTPEDAKSQGVAVPEPAAVPSKSKARKPSKEEVEDRSVTEDRNGLW